MPEETSLGVARARESVDEPTSSNLKHRMDEARESITDAVSEINETYPASGEDLSASLDWREQFRKHPIACSVGAIGLGMLVGYGLGGLIEEETETDFDSELVHPSQVQIEGGGPSAFSDEHSYASHARAIARVDDVQSELEEAKPGIIERFKETRAYDRLQEEVADLGNRFMDELAHAARTIVLPAIFDKLKKLIGVDLSNTRPAGKVGERQSAVSPAGIEPTLTPAGEVLPVIPSSESGRPAYPKSTGSVNKRDRLASDSSSTSGQSDNSPHINLNYDDRYERESKLFSRGEIKGFETAKPGESNPSSANVGNKESNVRRGGDFTYDPRRSSESSKDN